VAAFASFQYAAGIAPGHFEFGKGFTLEDEEAANTGLERSLLHIAQANDAMEVLDTPVGRAILDYKWTTYGKQAYFRSMVPPMVLIICTSIQSVAWYMVDAYRWSEPGSEDIDPGLPGPTSNPPEMNMWLMVGYGDSLLCFLTAVFMLSQEILEMYKEGMPLYFASGWNKLDLTVILVCLISTFTVVAGSNSVTAWTQVACMVCWMEVFNMLRADSRFGLIVRMYLNIAGDIKHLIILQCFLCVGAAFSFIGTFRYYDDTLPYEDRQRPHFFKDMWETLLYVYAMLLGSIELDMISQRDSAFLYQVMALVVIYIQTILLMNLIIAMMGESFEKVLQEAQKELTMDRAEQLIRVELTMGVAKMRRRGYLPRNLHVLLPKDELRTEYKGGSGQNAQWAGVAGTVNNELSRKISDYALQTEQTVRAVTEKKTEHLMDYIMNVKKDLKDHMNGVEIRMAQQSAGSGGGPAAAAALASQTGSPAVEEETLRRVVREELQKLLAPAQPPLVADLLQ